MNILRTIRGVVVSISFATYTKTVIGVSVLGFAGTILAHSAVQAKVRGLPHYREALAIVSNHEYARNSLGPPMKIGYIDLRDKANNYVGNLDSKLRVPLNGTISSGYMNLEADRPSVDEKFRTKKIELELDEFSVVIYERNS